MYLGIDIGGSFTKAGLIKNKEFVFKTQIPTVFKGKKGFFEMIFNLIDEMLKKNNLNISEVDGIGIGVCGMVSNGVLLCAVNLGLEKIEIEKTINLKYKVPVTVINDVSAFALAQSHTTDIGNLVFIAIGTGINIGVIAGKELFKASIEYGHTFLMSGKICKCGLNGCTECFVSGNAIISSAKKAGLDINKPEEIFDMYNTNQTAKVCTNNFLDYLSIVLFNITNTFRPEKIFIGGGLAASMKPFIKDLNKRLKQKNYGYKNAPAVTVEIAELSSHGGALGAALLAALAKEKR